MIRPSLHVIPVGDLVAHETTDDCPCGPTQQLNEHGNWIAVHHSLDGREHREGETPNKGDQ